MSGWLGALILQAGSSLICWEPLIRERELQARLPFCFQDQLTLKWLLQSPFYSHFFFLPSLSVQALESNTHMVLWLGCFWKADSLKKKMTPPPPPPTNPLSRLFSHLLTPGCGLAGPSLCCCALDVLGRQWRWAIINLSERSDGHEKAAVLWLNTPLLWSVGTNKGRLITEAETKAWVRSTLTDSHQSFLMILFPELSKGFWAECKSFGVIHSSCTHRWQRFWKTSV